MDKKKIICLLLIVFLLSGCNVAYLQGNIQEENSNKQIKGNNGLTLSIQNTLPEKLPRDTQIPIQFLIQNEGTHDLENTKENPLKYYLIFNSDSSIQNKEESNIKTLDEDLVGITQQRTIGGFTTQSFDITTLSQPTLKKTTTISGHLCYPYETKLEVLTCLDSSLFNLDETSFCEAKTQKFDSQGAPVAIKKIETNKLKKKSDGIHYSVKIYLENVGKGTIVKKDKLLEHCTGSLSFSLEERNIGLETITGNNVIEACENPNFRYTTAGEATCKNSNKPIVKVEGIEEELACGGIKQDESGKYIECGTKIISTEDETPEEDIFTKESKLTITILYGYQTGKSKTINIE